MSGLYLSGMEMPKPGRYEAVIIVLDKSTAEIAISPADDQIGYWKEYPLIPVQPHGRLIDADALMAHFEKIADIEWNKKAAPISWSYAFEDVMDDIENAPTIIPAEEVEG